jgi:signal transduction histidine kinase
LIVTDNGRGISEEIRDKVFDPFFTTKAADKGTGLGMAIVEAIVHQHGARLELESAVGEGTTVKIVFASNPEGGAQ